MGRWIATWGLLTCFSLTASAFALTADDYVVAGRVRLFEGTVAGLVQAGDIFEAGIGDTHGPDGGADRELIFLHAMAETALLFVDHNDVLAAEGFFRLAEAFGVPLDGMAFYESQMDRAAEAQGGCLWPAGVTGAEIRQTLCDAILPQLEAIIGELNSIGDHPDPFVVYLAPAETGLAGDLEVDYGDVLILKGLLLAYKGHLVTRMVRGLDVEEAVLERPLDGGDFWQDVLWGGRDLSTALLVLAEVDDDTGLLAQARQDWIAALTCYIAAADYIAAEDNPTGADPQEDEFVYVDVEARSRLDSYRQMLATLRDSLQEGAAAIPGAEVERTYDLYGPEAAWIGELTLLFDLQSAEGRSGRLTLADGTSLDVDWFGRLDDEQVGISMFSAERKLEGWLEGTMDGGLGTIRDGTLDLWGAASSTTTGLTGEITTTEMQPAGANAAPVANPGDEVAGETHQDDPGDEWMPSGFEPDLWQEIWCAPFELPTPLSHGWFALGRTGAVLSSR